MNLDGHDIAVCSWSLQPRDADDLIGLLKQIGLTHAHLSLLPLLTLSPEERASQADQFRSAGIEMTAGQINFDSEDYTTLASVRRTGGFVPDDTWPQRKERASTAGKIAAEFGCKGLSLHAGFIPTSNDTLYPKIVGRVREVASALEQDGVDLLLETGQESASELLQFINDLNCRNVGVNFDAANMVMYGSDSPISAVATLSRHIRHVHLKDAVASLQPRTLWGKEVSFGTGDVDQGLLLDALDEIEYTGPLAIERASGVDRVSSIKSALKVVEGLFSADE